MQILRGMMNVVRWHQLWMSLDTRRVVKRDLLKQHFMWARLQVVVSVTFKLSQNPVCIQSMLSAKLYCIHERRFYPKWQLRITLFKILRTQNWKTHPQLHSDIYCVCVRRSLSTLTQLRQHTNLFKPQLRRWSEAACVAIVTLPGCLMLPWW